MAKVRNNTIGEEWEYTTNANKQTHVEGYGYADGLIREFKVETELKHNENTKLVSSSQVLLKVQRAGSRRPKQLRNHL